jgi:hypothetical protein
MEETADVVNKACNMATQDRTSEQFQLGIHLPLLFIVYVLTLAMLPSSIPDGCKSDPIRTCMNFKGEQPRGGEMRLENVILVPACKSQDGESIKGGLTQPGRSATGERQVSKDSARR